MCLNMEEAALAAAHQATEASSELIRFAREGAFNNATPFGEEVVGKLAEALKLAIEMEDGTRLFHDEDDLLLLSDLKKALTAFVSGWIG